MEQNRYDFLRLLFAFMVCFFHIDYLALPGTHPLVSFWLEEGAKLGIQGFFVISGALVYGSYLRSKTVKSYAEKRVRRLYPAYFVIIMVPALISLAISHNLAGVFHYAAPNLVFANFVQPRLPGLFEHNPLTVVNGSLWTLKIEVMFYIGLPILAWILARLGKLKYAALILIIILAQVWHQYFLDKPGWDKYLKWQMANQLPGQMGFFACGILVWLQRARIRPLAGWFLLAGLIGLTLSLALDWRVLRPPAVAALVAGAAYLPGPLTQAARHGDLSYGVYITHFPIIQGLIAAGLFAYNPWIGAAAVLALTAIASLLMWHLIEKRFLLPSSHYRREAQE